MNRNRDEKTIAELMAQVMELRQDMRRLVAWLEDAEVRISRHFGSWSWRIGHLLVGAVKRVGLKGHRPAREYAIQRIFADFRRWRELHPDYAPSQEAIRSGTGAQVTLLAGDLGDGLGKDEQALLDELAAEGSVCVLGFLPEGRPQGGSTGPATCSVRALGRFPGWFHPLGQALVSLSDTRLVVLKPDMTSLGLGLLAHYHFGVPLVRRLATGGSDQDVRFEADWRDPAFLDPRSGAWKDLLAPAYQALPGLTDPPRALAVAARFAEWFAGFHACPEGAGGMED